MSARVSAGPIRKCFAALLKISKRRRSVTGKRGSIIHEGHSLIDHSSVHADPVRYRPIYSPLVAFLPLSGVNSDSVLL